MAHIGKKQLFLKLMQMSQNVFLSKKSYFIDSFSFSGEVLAKTREVENEA